MLSKIEEQLLSLSKMITGILIIVCFFMFPNEKYAKLKVERVSPDKNSTTFTGVSVDFTIKATDSDGLAYSEWFLTGKRQTRHIITGYSSTDTWTYSFENEKVYFINVTVFNLKKKSEMIIWKVTVTSRSAEPIVEVVYPLDEYVEVDVNRSIEFQINARDESCELERIDWFVENKLENSVSISGCEYRENWSNRFGYSGSYNVCANVYNNAGNYKSYCWTVYVKEKVNVYVSKNTGSNDVYNYESATTKKKKKSFIAIGYSPRSMSYTKLWKDMDSEPTFYEFHFKYRKDFWASRLVIWILDEDLTQQGYHLGSFSQVGAKAEFLLNIETNNEGFSFNAYLGGGLVYQSTNLDDDYEEYIYYGGDVYINRLDETREDKGYGYSYAIGAGITIGNIFGVFIEYNGVFSTTSNPSYENDMESGSSGVVFGAGIRF